MLRTVSIDPPDLVHEVVGEPEGTIRASHYLENVGRNRQRKGELCEFSGGRDPPGVFCEGRRRQRTVAAGRYPEEGVRGDGKGNSLIAPAAVICGMTT
jgi:hypothetical protein